MFSHLSIIFIHIQTSLKKIPHFLYYWFRGKNLHPSSKSGDPRKEGGADFDGCGDGEMLGIHRKHLDVLAELVNDGIGQFIAEADADIISLAAEHIKHLCLLARHVLLSVKFLALSGYCQRLADAFHPVHTIIAELLTIVGIEIVVAIVPEKGIGADNELLTVFGIGLFVACGGGIVEVAEADFLVFADGLVDAVGILDHTIIHAPHSVGNMVFSVQALHGVLTRKPFQFGGDFSCLFSCDEFGRLNTIHQKTQFVRLKGRVQKSVTLL